ncbi:hypothetical protein ONE63_005693 [Megalurothrips usitatus]|uniref:Uncharacterized protein n=1 Tax=Megalurothrips usitatus TaxID=439358 RepID=A0AAV7Y3L1_9NEOP|nr:hypothetical protein ONE63_005693 [Megalurothrips usitatus]
MCFRGICEICGWGGGRGSEQRRDEDARVGRRQRSRRPAETSATQKLITSLSNTETMDRYTQNNRANQMNPNHKSSGQGKSSASGPPADKDRPSSPGRSSGFQGSKSSSDNRANQLNPNNSKYSGSGKK